MTPSKEQCLNHTGVVQKLNNNDRRLQNIETTVNKIDEKVDLLNQYMEGQKSKDKLKNIFIGGFITVVCGGVIAFISSFISRLL
ncbi:MAG: hypothetical protein A4E26_01395 [Methanobacterium sp. PtaU1.Bin097]|jgi:hypothetical protein|nr:MAG: hypothetical protein A4E26_01395 [Methanobacterium sp. PtaU1.Bin097]